MRTELVVSDNPHVRVCAVLWRAHDLIVSGKRRRIASAVADAGFALCGPSSPELWRKGCDEALQCALEEWQRRTFGYGLPPLLAVFDDAKRPEERAELVALAGSIEGAIAQVSEASYRLGENLCAGKTLDECRREYTGALVEALGVPPVEVAHSHPGYELFFPIESRVPEPSDPVALGRDASDILTISDEVASPPLDCICTVTHSPDDRCPVHELDKVVFAQQVESDLAAWAEVDASLDRAFEEARKRRAERNEATRGRLVAVHVSMTESMPAWVLAKILAAAPVGATIAGIDTRWMTGELAVVLRHESFPRVPEGVEAPRVVARVFDSTEQVQVEWPADARVPLSNPSVA